MKILIGIKSVSANGSSNDSEGYSCFSITASNVTVIASGSDEELKALVKEAREQKTKLSKEISNLEDYIERLDPNLDYDKEYERICKTYPKANILIPNYDKLLIIEGEVL
jgi:hypothetical protein